MIDDLSIDLLKQDVVRANEKLSLTPKEFSLLRVLCEEPGKVFTRTQIAEQIWGIHFDFDTNVIDVAIRRLRLKIDANHQTKLIKTKRGSGYFVDAS